MKQTKIYCDYCGKEIKSRNEVKTIRTIWTQLLFYVSMGCNSWTEIGGDGCNDCYNSYKRWVKSREKLKEWNK
jgi:hypothetical protein